MKVEIKDRKLIVSIPLEEPIRPSASGKTLVIATTHGNQKTGLLVDNKEVTVGLNAYITNNATI